MSGIGNFFLSLKWSPIIVLLFTSSISANTDALLCETFVKSLSNETGNVSKNSVQIIRGREAVVNFLERWAQLYDLASSLSSERSGYINHNLGQWREMANDSGEENALAQGVYRLGMGLLVTASSFLGTGLVLHLLNQPMYLQYFALSQLIFFRGWIDIAWGSDLIIFASIAKAKREVIKIKSLKQKLPEEIIFHRSLPSDWLTELKGSDHYEDRINFQFGSKKYTVSIATEDQPVLLIEHSFD